VSDATDPLMDFCRALPGVTEDVKWGDNLVFSVGGKMFAVFNLPDGDPFSLKVDPDAFSIMVQKPGIDYCDSVSDCQLISAGCFRI